MKTGERVELKAAKYWLTKLTSYMYSRGVPAKKIARVTLRHSVTLDKRNKKDARAFCQVECGSSLVHCSKAIEDLHERFIVGILLHEIAHVVLGCDNEPDDEVAVDEWIIKNFPEAGYAYYDTEYNNREALGVEAASAKFVNKIEKLK